LSSRPTQNSQRHRGRGGTVRISGIKFQEGIIRRQREATAHLVSLMADDPRMATLVSLDAATASAMSDPVARAQLEAAYNEGFGGLFGPLPPLPLTPAVLRHALPVIRKLVTVLQKPSAGDGPLAVGAATAIVQYVLRVACVRGGQTYLDAQLTPPLFKLLCQRVARVHGRDVRPLRGVLRRVACRNPYTTAFVDAVLAHAGRPLYNWPVPVDVIERLLTPTQKVVLLKQVSDMLTQVVEDDPTPQQFDQWLSYLQLVRAVSDQLTPEDVGRLVDLQGRVESVVFGDALGELVAELRRWTPLRAAWVGAVAAAGAGAGVGAAAEESDDSSSRTQKRLRGTGPSVLDTKDWSV
jgi:hypothetical protein